MAKSGEKTRFADGLILGEGEAKYILSQVNVDEIIAIGSGNQCLEGKDGERRGISGQKMKLNEGIGLFVTDTGNFSDFDFFRYRLTQFVEGINIDTADFIDILEPERRMELIGELQKIFGEDLSKALLTLVQEDFGEYMTQYEWAESNCATLWKKMLSE